MKKKLTPKFLILDVDGVITDGTMIYDSKGKRYKIFGPDDHDSLKVLHPFQFWGLQPISYNYVVLQNELVEIFLRKLLTDFEDIRAL